MQLQDRNKIKCNNCESVATHFCETTESATHDDAAIDEALCDSCVLKRVREIVNVFVASGDPSYEPAMIMVAAIFEGPNVDDVVRLTGSSRERVETIASRMRSSRMWTDQGVDYEDWFDGRPGVIAFGLNLHVAEGVFVRTQQKSRTGCWVYQLVGWEESIEKSSKK